MIDFYEEERKGNVKSLPVLSVFQKRERKKKVGVVHDFTKIGAENSSSSLDIFWGGGLWDRGAFGVLSCWIAAWHQSVANVPRSVQVGFLLPAEIVMFGVRCF